MSKEASKWSVCTPLSTLYLWMMICQMPSGDTRAYANAIYDIPTQKGRGLEHIRSSSYVNFNVTCIGFVILGEMWLFCCSNSSPIAPFLMITKKILFFPQIKGNLYLPQYGGPYNNYPIFFHASIAAVSVQP